MSAKAGDQGNVHPDLCPCRQRQVYDILTYPTWTSIGIGWTRDSRWVVELVGAVEEVEGGNASEKALPGVPDMRAKDSETERRLKRSGVVPLRLSSKRKSGCVAAGAR